MGSKNSFLFILKSKTAFFSILFEKYLSKSSQFEKKKKKKKKRKKILRIFRKTPPTIKITSLSEHKEQWFISETT